jgi:hypothetical protein
VTVEIYAANMFCNPSLDDDLRGRLSPAIYTVKPGLHRIFCIIGGDRVLVASQHIGPAKGGGAFRILLR